MLSKDLNVDPPSPPRDRPEVLNQPVGIPCPAIMTIATSRLSSKTTTPTHHLAAAHTPRTAVPLSSSLPIYLRMLSLSTPCLLLLRDSTSNRKSSLPKANISFSQSRSHSFFLALRPPPFFVIGSGIFWALCARNLAYRRERPSTGRDWRVSVVSVSGKQVVLVRAMITPMLQRGYYINCVLHSLVFVINED